MEKDSSRIFSSGICWDVAVVVRDLESTVKHLEELGFGPFIHPDEPPGAEGLFYKGKPLESDFKALAVRIGNMQIEIIQPDDNPNPWKEFLDTRGEGIHHIGFEVDSIDREVPGLISKGFRLVYAGKFKPSGGFAYFESGIRDSYCLEVVQWPSD